jgi:hypothetical protein
VGALTGRQAERDRAGRDLARAERELRAVRAPAVDDALVGDFCAHLGEVLSEGDVRTVRRLLEGLGVRVRMTGRRAGEIGYRLPAELGGVSGTVLFVV